MFSIDIEKATLENNNYRKVLKTTNNQQLVLMSLIPGEDIPKEIHQDIDQFIRVEAGTGKVIIGENQNVETNIKDGSSVTITSGTWHRVVNTGTDSLKLYSIYSPPEHPPGLIQYRQPKVNKKELLSILLN